MIVAKYLDDCKKKLGISSTYALAKKWDISEVVLSRYYSGGREPEDFACFKIAETLELDPAFVIAQIKSETEKNEKKRNYFRSFGGAWKKVAVVIALAVGLSSTCLTGLNMSGNTGIWGNLFKRLRRFV